MNIKYFFINNAILKNKIISKILVIECNRWTKIKYRHVWIAAFRVKTFCLLSLWVCEGSRPHATYSLQRTLHLHFTVYINKIVVYLSPLYIYIIHGNFEFSKTNCVLFSMILEQIDLWLKLKIRTLSVLQRWLL